MQTYLGLRAGTGIHFHHRRASRLHGPNSDFRLMAFVLDTRDDQFYRGKRKTEEGERARARKVAPNSPMNRGTASVPRFDVSTFHGFHRLPWRGETRGCHDYFSVRIRRFARKACPSLRKERDIRVRECEKPSESHGGISRLAHIFCSRLCLPLQREKEREGGGRREHSAVNAVIPYGAPSTFFEFLFMERARARAHEEQVRLKHCLCTFHSYVGHNLAITSEHVRRYK